MCDKVFTKATVVMATIECVQVSLDGNVCEVLWKDSHVSRFHAKWLRYNCRCDDCRPPFSGVYRVDILKFKDGLTISDAHFTEDGVELRTEYKGDVPSDHVTRHPVDWLRAKCYCDVCLAKKIDERDVITPNITKKERGIPQMDNGEITRDLDRGLFKLTKYVVERGFCVVKNVPIELGTVTQTSDIVARNTENIAFTNFQLPFHQDQLQYECAPGVQLFHAVRFDECVKGGESKLADLFEAVQILQQEFPQHFRTLVEVPSLYDTIDLDGKVPRYFEHQKYPINLDYFGKVAEVNWHPGLHCAPQIREQDVDRYYLAHEAMLKIVRQKVMQYRFKMESGDLLIFNNRRMLHARDAFEENGGVRHLQGTYLKVDDLKSKYVTLAHKLGVKVVPPKIGNNSSF